MKIVTEIVLPNLVAMFFLTLSCSGGLGEDLTLAEVVFKMQLVIWAIVGPVTGWLAGKFMSGKGFGVLVDMLFGFTGAAILGWIFGKYLVAYVLPSDSGFIPVWPHVIVSIIGAVILVKVSHSLLKNK